MTTTVAELRHLLFDVPDQNLTVREVRAILFDMADQDAPADGRKITRSEAAALAVREARVAFLPGGQRRVYDALAEAARPMTPLELKRAMPGEPPVAAIRRALGLLLDADLVEAAQPHPGSTTTTYQVR